MASEKIPELNVGIIGHIDHGKTTLLSKLSGKFTDTHSEELKRGITIKLGYADMTIYDCEGSFSNKEIKDKSCKPLRYVSFIDAPGHEMLMATMLSGAAIIDAAILVIAANEGIKPQTREHFMVLQAKNLKNIIIVQNKIDLVSKERAFESYNEIRDFVKGTIAENSPIIPISTLQEINLEKIIEELAKVEIPKRDLDSEPIFLIARSFDINKPGTKINSLKGGVLGGVLKKGKLKVGDEVEIKPGLVLEAGKGSEVKYKTIKTKILSLYRGKESMKEVGPGASISIETSLDPFLTKTDSLTSCLLSKEGNLPKITYSTKLKYNLFDKVLGNVDAEEINPILMNEMLMLNVNTTITVGTIEKIDKEKKEVELKLNIPVIALKKENVGIARNFNGHWRLIGWGEISD
ncbi:MAG: translation initiation factor IF-2 subunit gamma [Candidatus Pacearchaeota archaeon]